MDALLIVEVGKLLKGLLDLLTKGFCLTESGEKEEKEEKKNIPKGLSLSGRALVQSQEMRNSQVTRHSASDNRMFNLIKENQIIRHSARHPFSRQVALTACQLIAQSNSH